MNTLVNWLILIGSDQRSDSRRTAGHTGSKTGADIRIENRNQPSEREKRL